MHTQDKWFITVGILFMVFFVWVSNAKAESRDLSCKVSTSTEETPKQFKISLRLYPVHRNARYVLPQ